MNAQTDLRRGRPRDPAIDVRVLNAARELLATKGLAKTSIQAIARLAQVRPNAIYRRWPNRLDLIEEAIFPGFQDIAFEPTGNLKADLDRFAETYRSVLAKPEVLAAIPFIFFRDHRTDDAGRIANQEWRSVRPLFRAILAAAPDAQVDRSVAPDDLFDLLIGAILHRAQMTTLGHRTDAQDRTVELICRAAASPTCAHQ